MGINKEEIEKIEDKMLEKIEGMIFDNETIGHKSILNAISEGDDRLREWLKMEYLANFFSDNITYEESNEVVAKLIVKIKEIKLK